MMSRITLALKRRFAKVGDMPYQPSPISTLDWHALTRPPHVMLGRGRVRFVERAQGDTSLFAVISHAAGEEDVTTSVALEDPESSDERDSGELEMVEREIQDKEGSKSPV